MAVRQHAARQDIARVESEGLSDLLVRSRPRLDGPRIFADRTPAVRGGDSDVGVRESRVLLDGLQIQPSRLEVALLGVLVEEEASLQRKLVGLGVLRAVPAERALLVP